MILNLLHRPDFGEKEHLFRLQQEYAHGLNLKVTLMVSVQALEDERIASELLKYEKDFGDELALWIWSFEREEMGGSAPFWLLSQEHKEKGFQYAYDLFKKRFNKEPVSVGCYLMDKSAMDVVRKYSPNTTTVIASCFEEGVKVFHGCNNSWYLFSEGVSWIPWYPSTDHSFRPAENKDDWNGLVAIPHLSRDLALAYESRNDFFASHPANVQRGLANKGYTHEYDYNLIDQYRMQEDFNDGYSFYHVHVNASWIGNNPNIYDPSEVSQKLYYETLQKLAELRDEGKVTDMYMSEYGEWHKNNLPIGKPMVGLGKEMLYGSGKHYFWYSGADCRVLVDANLGGSIGDLRPYIGKFAMTTGPDSKFKEIASYPYLIQSIYRTGTANHFADGSRTTLLVSEGSETLDLCHFRTKVASIDRDEKTTTVKLTPAVLTFQSGSTVTIETTYEFLQNGEIMITRNIDSSSDDINISEYLKGCYGYTEYQEDMHNIELSAGEESMKFAYSGRKKTALGGRTASAVVNDINVLVTLEACDGNIQSAEIAEGHLFEPYYTLKLNYKINQGKGEIRSCLKMKPIK